MNQTKTKTEHVKLGRGNRWGVWVELEQWNSRKDSEGSRDLQGLLPLGAPEWTLS